MFFSIGSGTEKVSWGTQIAGIVDLLSRNSFGNLQKGVHRKILKYNYSSKHVSGIRGFSDAELTITYEHTNNEHNV